MDDETGAGAVRNLLVTVVSVGLVMALAVYGPGLLPSTLFPRLSGPIGSAPATVPEISGGAPQVRVRGDEGTYRFAATQPGDRRRPVTYPSCRSVPVRVNLENAPDPAADLRMVLDALERVNEATGLRLEYVGASDARPELGRGPQRLSPAELADPDPVLVSFADADEVPQLGGDVAGLAGSVAVRQDGVSRYLTGQVTLDTESFGELRATNGGDDVAAAITLHEVAHLVGLDHVDDERELMYATTTDQRGFGAGDLEGLRRLGRGACP